MYENSTKERVLFWYLLLEQYGPTNNDIKFPDNYTADALRRTPLIKSDVTEGNITRETLSESYCADKVDGDTFPLTYRIIDKYQWKYKELVDKLKCANYHTKYSCGGVKSHS